MNTPADYTMKTDRRDRTRTLWVDVENEIDWPHAANRFDQKYRNAVLWRLESFGLIVIPMPTAAQHLDLSVDNGTITAKVRYPSELAKGHTWQKQADWIVALLITAVNEALTAYFETVQHMTVHSMLTMPPDK